MTIEIRSQSLLASRGAPERDGNALSTGPASANAVVPVQRTWAPTRPQLDRHSPHSPSQVRSNT
jgi:hypothetical protein